MSKYDTAPSDPDFHRRPAPEATLQDLSEQYDTLQDMADREPGTLADLARAVIPSAEAARPMPGRLHDSDVWETVSGWVFGCRTCLEHKVFAVESAALARQRVHDARPLPWWVERIGADQ